MLGCDIKRYSDNFYIQQVLAGSVTSGKKRWGIYGEPKKLFDEADFNEWINSISQVFSKISKGTKYNDVDQLIRLVS